MTATNIVLIEEQMKRAAGRLNADIQERLSAGGRIGHAWLLESLSRGLFGKPYGEVRATLLAAPADQARGETDGNNVAPRVLLIDYEGETFLALDGQYVMSTCPGTDMEVPDSAIQLQARTLASAHATGVNRIDLPPLLGDEWESEDVIELARMLGYFRYLRPLYELLHSAPLVIFKQAAERWMLDSDYLEELQAHIDEGQPWRSVIEREIVWSPDFAVGHDTYELAFTLADLGAAKEVSPKSWVVPSEFGEDSEIRLVLER